MSFDTDDAQTRVDKLLNYSRNCSRELQALLDALGDVPGGTTGMHELHTRLTLSLKSAITDAEELDYRVRQAAAILRKIRVSACKT